MIRRLRSLSTATDYSDLSELSRRNELLVIADCSHLIDRYGLINAQARASRSSVNQVNGAVVPKKKGTFASNR
jgi:hypothetical protein